MNATLSIPRIARALASGGLALSAAAQSMSIGPGGAQVSDGRTTVLAPPPTRVTADLRMNEMQPQQAAPLFFLNYGTSGRAGPFPLADGTAVGSKQSPYMLRRAADPHEALYEFVASDGKSTVYGPFAATNGATFTLGQTPMTLQLPPPRLSVSLAHPGRIAQRPSIGLAPYDRKLVQALYDLRGKYATLVDRVNRDTSDVQLAGVPRIHSRNTGNTFNPVITTSDRDRQNANKGAELTAMTFLEKLFAEQFGVRPQAVTDELTFHFQMPPGDYVLCVMQRVKDSSTQGMGSHMAVWWTPVAFDGSHPLTLALTAENAITWREIFPLDAK